MKRCFSMLTVFVLASALVPLAVHPNKVNARQGATPVAMSACAGPDGNGLIVYLDVGLKGDDQEAGDVQSAFVVFAPDGTELYRVPIDGVPTYYPLYVGCTVVVNDGGDQPMLFDPSTGEMRTLTMPEDFGNNVYPLNSWLRSEGGRRWAFLHDGDIGHALLVDTVSGEVTDLVAVVNELRGDDEIVIPLSVALTPDESTLLFATDRDTWVMSTVDPSSARLIADAVPGRVALSDDGTRLAYVAEPDEDRFQVVTERLDGSGLEIVSDADRATTVSWVPGTGGHELLVMNLLGGSGSVRTFVDGQERAIDLDVAGTLHALPLYSSSGRQVLLRIDDDGTGWVWLDLDTGNGRRLTELDGYPFPYSGLRSGLRWLTFYPSDQPSVEPGDVMLGLDLQTGTVTDLLAFDVEETYFGIPATNPFGVSADGRYVIVNDLGEEYPRYWLLDASQGTSTEFDGRFAQSFSPDGSQLIVTGPSDTDDSRVWETSISSVEGEHILTLAESAGRGGLWMPA
jgi:hypothetical protein